MNNPAKLNLREWKKPEVAFELHGWLPGKGLAFVVSPEKRRQVIQLVLPGQLARSHTGLGVAFPRTAPATITETCLLPPPCRTTSDEAECLRAAAAEAHSPRSTTKSRNASDLPNWELVWLRHRQEVLLPAPEDRDALAERLEVFKAKMRQEYEARRQELEEWRTKTIGQMIYLGGGRYYRELRHRKPTSMSEEIKRDMSLLEASFTRPLSEFSGRLHGGYLNWTVEVAKHERIIRDPVLHERWTKGNGLNLDGINADKEAFLNWYRPHCPAPMRRASNDFWEAAFPGANAAIANNALSAEVRFVANFSDGSRVWLADCPRRDPLLTADEQRPFEAPGPLSTPIGQSLDSITTRAEHVSALLALPEALTKAGQLARADVEAGATTLGARVEDLARTLGKFSEVFADPLVAAAREGSIDRKVPPEFAWWVFKERHFGKFPTVDGAYRSGLRPNLEKAGFAFSRATVHRWLTVIHEELEKRKLDPKRRKGSSPDKARDFDVAQAKDTGPLPGDTDEPPDEFVEWVQEKHAAGVMPSEDYVLDWLCARAGNSSFDSCSEDKLREIAKKWLKQAAKILGLDQTEPPEPDEDSDP